MKHVLAALCALGLAGCAAPVEAPALVQGAEAACAAEGGRLERVGRAQTLQCVIPYADANKACRDGSECEAGRCIGAVEAAGEANATGQCQADNMRFGCYTTIVDGRAESAICVD